MSRCILITGCSSGFGHHAALHFARQGHHVLATMRGVSGKNREIATDLIAQATSENLEISVYEMDVTSTESVDAAVSQMPPVDVLINNAGTGFGGPVESFTPEQILAQLDVNVVGPVRVARAVLPSMRERGEGLIIQVSSTAGRIAFPGFGVYHASKWGLEGLSEAFRYELAPHGIDVVLVEPGPFSTNFFSNLVDGDDTERAAAYPNVADFGAQFEGMVGQAFEETPALTDPSVVTQIFDDLIQMPAGERPLRTIAGLGFGVEDLNEITENFRKEMLDTMGLADVDGPAVKA